MSSTISVVAQGLGQIVLEGPVPVQFIVTNHGSQEANILMPFPNPNNLSFQCLLSDFAEPKPVEPDAVERTAPIAVSQGGRYMVTYYLNRYFKFKKQGKAKFSYSLRMLVTSGKGQGTPRNEAFQGVVEIELVPPSDDQLHIEFAKYGAQLNSSDQSAKMEAAEALAFLETPRVIPYLFSMLRIDNLAVIGIHGLGRHPSPQSEQAIVAMLGNSESAVVEAALEEIDRLRIGVPRTVIQKLLASANPGIQWLALNWLAARPNREDLPLVEPLLKSTDPSLREQAGAYAKKLERN